jgi:hypothetical protein
LKHPNYPLEMIDLRLCSIGPWLAIPGFANPTLPGLQRFQHRLILRNLLLELFNEVVGLHTGSCFPLSIARDPGRRDRPSRANKFKLGHYQKAQACARPMTSGPQGAAHGPAISRHNPPVR